MKATRQTTLRRSVSLRGVGVHSGEAIGLSFHPAEADTGIVFIRTDSGSEREIRVEPRAVAATDYATVLGDRSGPAIATVEHALAALYGLGVDNAVIEVDGPEVPIMDGSAAPFVQAIDSAGLVTLAAPRRYLKILKPVGVVAGQAYGELRPYDRGFRLDVQIEFPDALIGKQSLELDVDAMSFRRQLARARTFGFTRDVKRLWEAGYALGASLENTVVVGEGRVLNPEGLRFSDEFVRHKALDALGDLSLAGAPILGAYRSVRGGHRLNFAVLSALIADPSAWTMVEAPAPAEQRDPLWKAFGGADLAGSLAAQPVFAPTTS